MFISNSCVCENCKLSFPSHMMATQWINKDADDYLLFCMSCAMDIGILCTHALEECDSCNPNVK